MSFLPSISRNANLFHPHGFISSDFSIIALNKNISKPYENIQIHSTFSYLRKFILPALALLLPALFVCNAAHAVPVVETFSSVSQTASESGFVQSFLLIFVSEIGDKTFFIAALLAAKYGKFISFLGSMSALGAMTIISTVLGQIFHQIPSSLTNGVPFDDYIAVAAFTYFGLKTVYDASRLKSISDNAGLEEEKEEAEKSISELKSTRNGFIALLIQIFTLVFAAEVGDRSFLSTIALSAALNPFAVGIGAIAAHATATGVAVLGGEFLSKYLSEKVIGYIGGAIFLVFALTTALGLKF
jgi:putative Ca2+/H+ antiporter (TMEM165/GDT1 family)